MTFSMPITAMWSLGTHHDVTRFGHAEVGASHSRLGREELVAQAQARHVGEVRGVVVALLAAQLALEEPPHLLLRYVYGRHDDVAGPLAHQLQYALAQVCLHHLYSALLEKGVRAALLGEHRLALHHLLDAVAAQDVEHGRVHLPGVFGPVHGRAVGCGAVGEAFQIGVEVGQRVLLDVARRLAQPLPLAESAGHAVALVAQCPECGVVPRGVVAVFEEGGGRL